MNKKREKKKKKRGLGPTNPGNQSRKGDHRVARGRREVGRRRCGRPKELRQINQARPAAPFFFSVRPAPTPTLYQPPFLPCELLQGLQLDEDDAHRPRSSHACTLGPVGQRRLPLYERRPQGPLLNYWEDLTGRGGWASMVYPQQPLFPTAPMPYLRGDGSSSCFIPHRFH